MNLTDEELDALARRLADAGWKDPRVCNFDDIAREAARWAEERQGEPVAWMFWHRSDPDASLAAMTRVKENAEHLASHGYIVQPLYTTPPSADALVEAVTDHCADLDRCAGVIDANAPGFAKVANEIRVAASELRAALAAHKENTDGR